MDRADRKSMGSTPAQLLPQNSPWIRCRSSTKESHRQLQSITKAPLKLTEILCYSSTTLSHLPEFAIFFLISIFMHRKKQRRSGMTEQSASWVPKRFLP